MYFWRSCSFLKETKKVKQTFHAIMKDIFYHRQKIIAGDTVQRQSTPGFNA
jgi:hypothetical protein